MTPYNDNTSILEIVSGASSLNIENSNSSIAIYGEIEITNDQNGLQIAKQLFDSIDAIYRSLKSRETSLPISIEQSSGAVSKVLNPLY